MSDLKSVRELFLTDTTLNLITSTSAQSSAEAHCCRVKIKPHIVRALKSTKKNQNKQIKNEHGKSGSCCCKRNMKDIKWVFRDSFFIWLEVEYEVVGCDLHRKRVVVFLL